MSAEAIAKALGGRKTGATWMARCPVHDDRAPSLSIRTAIDGKVLVHCHAGCPQRAVIGALRARGIWDAGARRSVALLRKPNRVPPRETDGEAIGRTDAALRIWRGSCSPATTLAETYLHWRGLTVPVADCIRFQPRLKHPSGTFWPAMIALVTRGDNGVPVGIHRTFLAGDGRAKAPVDPSKMMLGSCRGGAVRLGSSGNVLMVGEGIETCLAAMQASGLPAWAALSTSGLRALDLPRAVHNVIVLADGDDAGEAAARHSAWRWKREGRHVRIARPPQGMDFNVLLLRRATQIKEALR